MFVTPVDGIVIVVVLCSALLAMVRGFSREAFSLLTWVIAGVAAYFLYPYPQSFLSRYLSSNTTAVIMSLIVVFAVFFLVLYPIFMKLSDLILDSKAGVIDRTAGFIFGILRGVLIMALATLLLNHLITPENRHPWIEGAKTKPMLDAVGNGAWNALPNSILTQLNKIAGVGTETTETPDNDIENAEPVE